ncbi:MAG TPA: glycoside hydrolase family 3 N-terminal domain-containing protein [Verrucomicrobiota bacterium]|nr:glycoside hydrolase family 3 N-terminal domain-containing protein [Verrucomicrobiota bacterium]
MEALLRQMTLDEKIGQMTQVDSDALKDRSHIQKYALGSVLSGGSSDTGDNSPQAWLQLAQECHAWAAKTRLKIPLLYGIDAIHGHNNVDGAVVFPHNIGLGATRNPALVEQAARITAREVAGTGINWTFAPCVAVALDPRWGRTYESFSDSPELAGRLGAAAVRGFQGDTYTTPGSILACAKHYVGDGGTRRGVDQGDTVCDEATLRQVHLSPYKSAIAAGVGSVMASFSSWNGTKMHAHKYLLTDVLKGELGFKGFVVSDWAGIDQLSRDYKHAIELAINAGLDMAMVPNGPGQKNNYIDFITHLKDLVTGGRVPQARIDDAVRRILRVKFEAGLFDLKPVDPALTTAIGSAEHRSVARECVRQSLVLLKNDPAVLPLRKNAKHIAVVGSAADDLGIQCGGWTVSWQGQTGRVMRAGTTILQAIRQTVSSDTTVTFSPDASGIGEADAVVAVIGEHPYAEGQGDRAELRLSASDAALVAKAKQAGKPLVTILLSGRPLVLGETLDASDAFIAAWLPGTEGLGVADVLFGDYAPTGKLPRIWPGDAKLTAGVAPAFPFGFGLTDYGRKAGGTRTAAATP